MTKIQETVASMSDRIEHAIQLKLVEIVLDGLDAIFTSDKRRAAKGE